jgi:hypothetical protein
MLRVVFPLATSADITQMVADVKVEPVNAHDIRALHDWFEAVDLVVTTIFVIIIIPDHSCLFGFLGLPITDRTLMVELNLVISLNS